MLRIESVSRPASESPRADIPAFCENVIMVATPASPTIATAAPTNALTIDCPERFFQIGLQGFGVVSQVSHAGWGSQSFFPVLPSRHQSSMKKAGGVARRVCCSG